MPFQKRKQYQTIKILLLGDGAVGKTSLRSRYIGDIFSKNYQKTIGADFASRDAEIRIKNNDKESYICRMLIWDISGQPRFEQVARILFDHSDACLVLFDISNRESLESCQERLKIYNQYSDGMVYLIGNKADLRSQNGGEIDILSTEEIELYTENLSKKMKMPIQYIETSAKEGTNVNFAFECIAKTFLERKLVSA